MTLITIAWRNDITDNYRTRGHPKQNSFVHDPNKIIIITYFFPLRAFIYVITQKLKIAIEIDTLHKCNATYFSIVIRASLR